ncbi:D-alanine--D-alanine ligase [uncultured Cardiobacterium sp.]|uniref:D-alanine--D-alanine ligase n=1 Tax=uncultured Cardiobacterium sp. TaxID=417619 RepID=UPI002614A464|nr:D-alanine--D-alanine ligase [uncultured Cardiobacterium sp.]
MNNEYGKVAVLYGGTSSEREVSLASGAAVHEALVTSGVDAHLLDTRDHQALFNLKAQGYARAFIVLHGRGGEDGQVQAILDWQGIPYTGSGVLACALAMDKVLTKRVWQASGLPIQPDVVIDVATTYDELVLTLGARQFAIKPALEGSSVGVSRVTNQAELVAAYQKAGGIREKVMAEPWVAGRELTYPVVGGRVLPGIEVTASAAHLFYDYDAKYLAEDTRYLCPPPIDAALDGKIRELTRRAFDVIGAKGWARVDFILDGDNRPWLLEINMVPGMTSHSLVPLAARTDGMDFAALVLEILAQTR